jgi:hypothetical protein
MTLGRYITECAEDKGLGDVLGTCWPFAGGSSPAALPKTEPGFFFMVTTRAGVRSMNGGSALLDFRKDSTLVGQRLSILRDLFGLGVLGPNWRRSEGRIFAG